MFSFRLVKRNDLSIEIMKYLMMSSISGHGGGSGLGRSMAQVLRAPAAAEWFGRQGWRAVQHPPPGLGLSRVSKGGRVGTGPLGSTGIQVYSSCEKPSAYPAGTKILEI